MQWSNYVNSITIHVILNSERPDYLFKKIKTKLIYHDRSNLMYMRPTNKIRIGKNCISNRCIFMKQLNVNDFKMSKDSFKKYVKKKKFLNPAF